MINIINNKVRRDFVKLINYDGGYWTKGNYKNEWGIEFVVDEKTRMYYSYPDKESAENDYEEIKRIKELCKQ
jgi:hypothetical protein